MTGEKRENKRQIGSRYEEKAKAYLESLGFLILEQNFRCRWGEIDLIGREDGYLVFIEVKHRKDTRCGYPEEAVHRRKQQTISRVSDVYRMQHRLGEVPMRFDVVADLDGRMTLFRDAFPYFR